jgi:hypothetical protein
MADRIASLSSIAYTYPDPYLSLWQSAALAARAAKESEESLPISERTDDLMLSVTSRFS